MQFRRSLVVVKDLNAGDVQTRDNVREIRSLRIGASTSNSGQGKLYQKIHQDHQLALSRIPLRLLQGCLFRPSI